MSVMQHKLSTTVGRIIAKIDNDFNPDNSDWIPRVGAWVTDALSMIDALRVKTITKKLTVRDKIAYSNCLIDDVDLKVYDSKGCEIKRLDDEESGCQCSPSPTGGQQLTETAGSGSSEEANTLTFTNTGKDKAPNMRANYINSKFPYRYNVVPEIIDDSSNNKCHNYVVVDCDKIELNFDDKFITIKTKGIETECDTNGCDYPKVPNIGVVIEYVAAYCMYKMLCRGYKHPVFNLAASQYGTNPYFEMTRLKEEARRAVINGATKDDDAEHLRRSAFFIETFDSRH